MKGPPRLFTAWNTLSRVDVLEGPSRRMVLIDAGTAVTGLVHPEVPVDSLGPTEDEEAFFVRLFARPRVLVVGSGGGVEVLLALRNGASRVVAVEINPAINELMRTRMAGYTGHLYEHPQVQAVTDEAAGDVDSAAMCEYSSTEGRAAGHMTVEKGIHMRCLRPSGQRPSAMVFCPPQTSPPQEDAGYD